MKKNRFLRILGTRKIVVLFLITFSIITLLSVVTYAYFTASIGSSKNEKFNLATGTMALLFEDNDEGINAKLTVGESVTKKFKITNTGTLESSLSMVVVLVCFVSLAMAP